MRLVQFHARRQPRVPRPAGPVRALLSTSLALALAPAVASPVGSFSDDFSLANSSYRSMWSAGKVQSFSASTSLALSGGGSYSVGGISGSAPHQVCDIPLIGSTVCSVTDETRTGVAVGVSGNGSMAMSASVSGNGGGIKVTLPVSASLRISSDGGNGFRVSGAKQINGSAARIDIQAPNFGFTIGGSLAASVRLDATTCAPLIGCASGGTSPAFAESYPSLISLNMAQAKPLNVLGTSVSVPGYGKEYVFRSNGSLCDVTDTRGCSLVQSPALVHFTLDPLLNVSGTGLQLQTHTDVLTVNADLLGIAQALYGLPVDVVNPGLRLSALASVSGKTVDPEAGLVLGYSQSFRVDPGNSHVGATLTFDRPVVLGHYVTAYTSCPPKKPGEFSVLCQPVPITIEVYDTQPVGNSFTYDLDGGPVLFKFADGSTDGNLLTRSYFWTGNARPTLIRSDDITIDPDMRLRVGCFDVNLPVADVGERCLYDETEQTNGLLSFDAFDRQFRLAGWQGLGASFFTPPPAGVPYFLPIEAPIVDEDLPETVPLPGTAWLASLALALGGARRRRAR